MPKREEETLLLPFPENGDMTAMVIMDFDDFVEDLVNERVSFE